MVIIPARWNGPRGSGNGGWTCGRVAEEVRGAPVEVTLRQPPPLETELTVTRGADGSVTVHAPDGGLVAEGRRVEAIDVDLPAPVDLATADLRDVAPGDAHPYPTCVSCGHQRMPGDGMRLFARLVEGRPDTPGLMAAPWTPPADVDERMVWTSLDCPGGWAVGYDSERDVWWSDGPALLGRMTAYVTDLPRVGDPHVVMAWPLGKDGRKRPSATALLDASGRVLAVARAVWIVPG